MRLPREITSEKENFRLENIGGMSVIRRDSIEPEPVGTVVLIPMLLVGYDKDCDGSLMARYYPLSLEQGNNFDDLRSEDALITNFGLYGDSGFIVTLEELEEMKCKALRKEDTP